MIGNYTAQEILSHCDHTALKQTAVWEDIRQICDDGMRCNTASVCIPPCFVKQAYAYINHRVRICTVIGFPNGYQTTRAKRFEAEDAVENGADEIDMVINLSFLKNNNPQAALYEINEVKTACQGKILKVIIETGLLTYEEKLKACRIVSESDADYIKTSTGFTASGATFDDVKLLCGNCTGKKVKAAGGIKSIEDAVKFLEIGADRLGSSSLVNMIEGKINE
ncbi:MAG: deoxyribose-phosphate aldolase [Eubacteriales bacterium]|nr:deoxyribose-phosphate aldolase [Eubacteriales bacterium]